MKNWLLVLALPLLVLSCRKDIDELTTTTTTYQETVVEVVNTLTGQVIDADRNGIPGVVVRVGGLSAITDANGFYQFPNATVNARGTYITAYKNGYFPASDRCYPLNNSAYFSTIQLLPKNLAGTIQGSAGGTVAFQDASVTFGANTIAYPSSQDLYSGNVNVYARWLDPTAPDLEEFMPGNLFGVNTKGEAVAMATFGMMAVELYDDNGNELQIATGRKATLRMKVPAEIRATAPTEIPLWYFDEAAGLWIEEGKAALQGDEYVGEVSHFTYWNADFPSDTPLVYVHGCIQFPNGNPAGSVRFEVYNATDGYRYVTAQADAAGHFSGLIPSDVPLRFDVVDQCGVNATFNVEPLTDDTTLECFVINSPNVVDIAGQVNGCSGAVLANAIVNLNISANWAAITTVTDAQGNFSFTLTNCGSLSDFTLEAYDLVNLSTSGEQSYTLAGTTMDIGVLEVCDNPLDEYIISDVNGVVTTFIAPQLLNDSIGGGTAMLILNAGQESPNNDYANIYLTAPSMDPGSYTGIGVDYTANVYSNGAAGATLFCRDPCANVTVVVTSNTGPGGHVTGTFSGTASGWDAQQNPITDAPVSGSFRVRIPQ